MSIEIFGRYRMNFIKLYEILKACMGTPLNPSQLGSRANIISHQGRDPSLLEYLVSKGFLAALSPEEYMKTGSFRTRTRKPNPLTKFFYQTTPEGTTIVHEFEALFRLLELHDQKRKRFP